MPAIRVTQEAEIRRILVQSQAGQIIHEALSKKYQMEKRAGEVIQVVKHQTTKFEALSSGPSSAKIMIIIIILYKLEIMECISKICIL
jgi:hypothetical protein